MNVPWHARRWWPPLAAATGFGAVFLWLYAPLLAGLVRQWGADENYSHGYLVPPLAMYFAWQRRGRLLNTAVRPATLAGLGLLVLSLGLLVAGIAGAELFLARVSMIGVLAGVLVFVRGWPTLRALAFPLAFLLLMIPLPAIVFNQITMPLQLFASRVGEWSLGAVGIPALREGNVVLLPYTALEVVEACSGIRSIVSLLTIGIVFVQFTTLSPLRRLLVVASTIPLAVLANGLRVAGTGIAAHYWGSDVADGAVHTTSGWVMFVVTFAAVMAFARTLETTEARTAAPGGAQPC